MKNIPLGSHLICKSKFYEHHGIYIGNGEVVHYVGWDEKITYKKPISKTSINSFHDGNPCFILSHPCQCKFCQSEQNKKEVASGTEIVQRALSMLQENEYNLVNNNCEHFVMWCIYGIKTSDQSEQATKLISTAILTGVGLVAGGGLPVLLGGLYVLGTRGIPFIKKGIIDGTAIQTSLERHEYHTLAINESCSCKTLKRIY